MAEALLYGLFNLLLERLTPEHVDLINFICGKKLEDKLLHHLKPSLIAARAVLNDAELKEFKDQAVKDWLDELRDAAYDLEDFMDEIFTRSATQNKVRNLNSASLNLHDTSMADKLEAIIERIEYIVREKDALSLKKSNGTEALSWRPLVKSNVEVSRVYGRKEEKEDIIKLMFNGEGGELSVITIVGMGGVGKTTLVQLVYNDNDVQEKFDLAVWVCVSKSFDLMKIERTIIKSISHDFVCDNMDLNLLQLHLAEKLEGKKFLVVLDDVWYDKYTDWDTLKNLLDNGVQGCQILVTTRLESVAMMVKTIPSFYRLNVLSDEDCLSIFAANAFNLRYSTVNSCLQNIGRNAASKCKGLPLAAKVLGGLFRSKPNFEDWNNILKDTMWDSLDKDIVPALRVSYCYLPPHLKQCLAYCSLFPEDYQFDREELVLMWMAEGILQPSKGNMSLEEVGYGYFDDLISRSFFQPLPKNDVHFPLWHERRDECFVMHDLIHELATHVAGDLYFRFGENGNKIGNKTRHFSCNFQNYSYLDHEIFQKSKGLRTFIGLNFSDIPRSIENASHILLSNLKYLRMLSLRDLSALKTVPESIGEFTHLRYLDLSKTCIESLPDSICKLYNLQILKLCHCTFLEILPSDMQDLVNLCYLDLSWSRNITSLPGSLCKLYNLQTLRLQSCLFLEMLPGDMQDLVNLRHLDVRGTRLKQMPRGLGNLKDLQFLSDFIVGKEQEAGIGELGGTSNLKGWIEISKLENVKNGNQAYNARMMEKKHIKGLALSWSWYTDMEDTRTERNILANLQPHWDLEQLKIDYYRGTIFPDWLGSPSYHNMTWLQLENCQSCCKLPPLGQLPTLKRLYIVALESVITIGDEFLRGNDSASSMIPFQSLEYLMFSRMASWEKWHSIENMEAFPKLQQLKISHCEKLVGNLPCQFLSLETLQIVVCPLFSSSMLRFPKLQNLTTYGSGNMLWPRQDLPLSLCNLVTTGCQMLESMLDSLSKHSHMQQLTIVDCFSTSPPMIHLPLSLRHLIIRNCGNAAIVMSSNAPLQNLQSVTIECCDSLKFMSDNMEGCLLPNLRKLHINGCTEMEEFPEEIFVPSLRELHIENCNKLLSHEAKWDLLRNITYLRIHYPDGNNCHPHGSYYVKCFPEGFSLPITITNLELYGFSWLETLNCTGLQYLTSLQQLKIVYCRKLEKMSGEKLPASLRKLHIRECPLLEEKYHKKDEKLLRQISHIPHINIHFAL